MHQVIIEVREYFLLHIPDLHPEKGIWSFTMNITLMINQDVNTIVIGEISLWTPCSSRFYYGSGMINLAC